MLQASRQGRQGSRLRLKHVKGRTGGSIGAHKGRVPSPNGQDSLANFIRMRRAIGAAQPDQSAASIVEQLCAKLIPDQLAKGRT